MARDHLPGREACPHLPGVGEVVTAEATRQWTGPRDAEYYLAALRYAQSLWLEGKAAQALLQLNKALMATLEGDEEVLAEFPLPYAAKAWIMTSCPRGEFLGNPVRHYQHLATRMSGPQPELRRWRAWGCFHLSEAALVGGSYPRDDRQIETEGIRIPERAAVLARLAVLGLPGEARLLQGVWDARR